MTALLAYLLIGTAGSLLALYRNRRFLPRLINEFGPAPMAAGIVTMVLAAAAAWPVVWPLWWHRERAATERANAEADSADRQREVRDAIARDYRRRHPR